MIKNISKIQLIRNATVVLHFGGQKFLIDPFFADKGTYPAFPESPNAHLSNPTVDLPFSKEQLLDPDAIILTHLHVDHWDESAISSLPKDKRIYAQNEEDAVIIRKSGFTNVLLMNSNTSFKGVELIKTVGQHGPDSAYAVPELAKGLGKTSGVIFKHRNKKTVFLIGDSIWTEDVEKALLDHKPDVVIINAGFAQADGFGGIIMGKEDTYRINQLLPDSLIVAVHMEALNHCILSRDELRSYAMNKGISEKLIVPEDGEEIFI